MYWYKIVFKINVHILKTQNAVSASNSDVELLYFNDYCVKKKKRRVIMPEHERLLKTVINLNFYLLWFGHLFNEG